MHLFKFLGRGVPNGMADPSDEMLREAARARGFRLVKSRRRKPGGDFGRYGLTDLKSGRECMGFGDKGLTGTAEEVLAYLRGGEVASWKRSLIGVVGADEPEKAPKKREQAIKTSVRPERSRGAPAPKAGRHTDQSPAEPREKKAESPGPASRGRPSTSAGTSGEGRGQHEDTEEARKPPPEPTIREASRRDAAALARLLGIPAAGLGDRLAAALRADEPPLLADQDGLVGVAAWTTIPNLHEGPRGRITLLLVAEDHRRQGVGTRLLAEAEQRLRDAGIETVELAIEIDFDAPTGFLRRTGYARSSNGYGKTI